MEALTPMDFDEYLADLKDDGNQTSALRRKLAPIHGMYAYMQSRNMITADPSANVKVKDKFLDNEIVYLTDEEFAIFGIKPDELYRRYDHVIFLKGDEENFCNDETTTRLETDYAQIAALGIRSQKIWSKHPSFTEIPQQDKVEAKAEIAA